MFLVQHESGEGKSRLNENLCKSQQNSNHDECRCESKE